jgi:anti-sigma regulatory factor (Ser/Thr protein kinase)
MKELSLHILDITKNSVSAGAKDIRLTLTETEEHALTIVIADDGCGMSPEFLARVTDPFTTTRTTRKVGMGLPLYRMAAEMTGGSMAIESTLGVGTTVTAVFHVDHLDCAPLGDLPGVLALLIQGSPLVDFTLERTTPKGSYQFSTKEVREQLGPDVPLDEPEVFLWLNDYLQELEAEV